MIVKAVVKNLKNPKSLFYDRYTRLTDYFTSKPATAKHRNLSPKKWDSVLEKYANITNYPKTILWRRGMFFFSKRKTKRQPNNLNTIP